MIDEPETGSSRAYAVRPGSRFPPGASEVPGGINFCIFCRHATRVELLLYEAADSPEPFQIVTLAADTNRTFFFWHVMVEALPIGTHYTWRVDGPRETQSSGERFDPDRELLDPDARAVSDALWTRPPPGKPSPAGHATHRAIVTETLPVCSTLVSRGLDDALIYELHVGGFTRHASSGVEHPGTFAGLIEKIPYLKQLGVTHVELLPVMAFDEQDVPPAAAARGLTNYWGYSTHSYYSPHPRYCRDPARAPQEFRALTDALHTAGIGVLLDVVFNHTAEAGETGPIINFKGLGNDIFYHLDAADRRRYRDYTGCGNTVNCNHPLVTTFIVHCLEYWVVRLGVDGFRFDLASVFARDQRGELMPDPPLPWAIESSRVLSHVPLIAEAWDAAGMYQVGAFPGMAWAEWNGRYRDVIRRFVRGDPGIIGEVATCIAGSSDLYADDGRLPNNSINYVTCHDGFTLMDLVSYESKRNEANGDENRDGTSDNLSWNCGAEGETGDARILGLRHRQARNLMALLFLSQGVPMMLAGDEVLRSQRGNNNAYCQDNALSWFDWTPTESGSAMLRFVQALIALRKRHASLRRRRFLTGRPSPGQTRPDVAWHGERLHEPGWHDPRARLLVVTLGGEAPGEPALHAVFNMDDGACTVQLPAPDGQHWRRIVDTARDAPHDIVQSAQQAAIESEQCRVEARSVVVLEEAG
ncbi:glycogen debranching protein GlgX [Paraburkholderia sp. MMS20-SJTN17]|uniref:Glycogen debranching protein GlgX n=1 Tax=Paraburkholderia translucens TaxID=2886945 RepID=A0ABS8KA31_9BURK|nr:glycogen debranching protein GlgX [Paraburkholderia sp. MMS20-SJTN17]MCC8401584.1 glycogen debranching protein GlgX [Paraburkholderia sp. MMS20-SJTN17]